MLRRFSSGPVLNALEEYSRGLDLLQNGNFAMAEQDFQRCVQILNNSNTKTQDFPQLLSRLALTQRLQKKYTQTEHTMETIVQHTSDPELSNANLMKQYLESNLDKAVSLGTSLLQKHSESFQKQIKELLGIAYLLQGNTKESKPLLSEFKDNPFALNNLACAQWWDLLSYSPDRRESDDYKASVFEFSQAIPNLQISIQLFESNPEPYKVQPDDPQLNNKHSGICLTNIAEIHFQSASLEVVCIQEALKWLKCALKFYDSRDTKKIGRTLTLLGVFLKNQQQFMHAEGLFRKAENVLKNSGSYNEAMLYEIYGSMLLQISERKSEADSYFERAKEIKDKLPYWAERAANLHIPVWHIS